MILTIADTATPRLKKLMNAVGVAGRTELHGAMGYEVQRLTVDYLRGLAATRHTTAQKLGAAPSNHLAQAAEKAESSAALTANASNATLTINHPGMIRALRDVTIRPVSAKSLAIPVHALSYNRRPAQIWDVLKLFIPKGKNVICMASGNQIVALYVLVRSVTQTQDRSLLPSDEQFEKSAARGALKYFKAL